MSASGKSSTLRHGVILLAVSTFALSAGYWVADSFLVTPPDLSGLHGTVFGKPRDIGSFKLADHTGKTFDNLALQGRWSFVFFGYTHCPDVCPTTLSVLNSVARKLEDHEDDVQFVFITVDPERDTPEKLGQFVSYFNGAFIGVTGSNAAISELTRQLGVIFARVTDNAGADNYLMDHTASVLLFDPAGRFHAVFSPPLNAADITDDFGRISQAYR
jgi:protein SCO1/2